MPKYPVLSVRDTDAYVMHRSPFFLHPEGMLIMLEGAWVWQPVPYVEVSECGHQDEGTMCYECQKVWYWDHNIRLVNKDRPEIYTDFDAVARKYREDNGIPEPALDPNPYG